MKVKCDLCGTKFELYSNNCCCPECGLHYHVDGETKRSFEGFSASYSTSANNSLNNNDSFVKEQMRQEKIEHLIENLKYNYEKNSKATSYDMHQEIHDASKKAKPYANSNLKNAATAQKQYIGTGVACQNSYTYGNSTPTSVKPLKIGKPIAFLIFLGVFLFVIIVILAMGIYKGDSSSVSEDGITVNEEQFIADTPIEISVCEPIYLDFGTLCINEIKIESQETWSALDGYSLVSIKYSLDKDKDFDGYAFERLEAFLTTKSGSFLEAASTYSIEEDSNMSTILLEEDEYTLCDDIYLNNGIMFYVVKTDDIAGLYIKQTDEQGNYVNSYNITDTNYYIITD